MYFKCFNIRAFNEQFPLIFKFKPLMWLLAPPNAYSPSMPWNFVVVTWSLTCVAIVIIVCNNMLLGGKSSRGFEVSESSAQCHRAGEENSKWREQYIEATITAERGTLYMYMYVCIHVYSMNVQRCPINLPLCVSCYRKSCHIRKQRVHTVRWRHSYNWNHRGSRYCGLSLSLSLTHNT